ncbi:polyketide cyclase/dehydrase/lipid transport protein [Pseudonocardia sediminis]|uniref:Polyketide cyclase/dehydrase/lipid transport protein n=1 Tax=Pseudonocardia sediminis TaxID=1397368 RepID=A0A4Q7UW36_PSEST|nr:SRPBCC family protein [Pseudonocardia sediminis]RZT85071.1 polyketide cyclase/dehydrase/lipid transport protein [Pseudonocardia sediminis]
MRYADGPTAESEIVVDAPAEALWPLVTDLSLMAELSSELQRVDWLDGADGPASDVRFRGHSAHSAIGEWSTVSTVTVWEPGRRFGWEVERDQPGGPAASWLFELAPAGGGTRVRQWARLGPGPSGLTPAIERRPDKEERMVAVRLDEWRSAMEANLAAFKERAESGS